MLNGVVTHPRLFCLEFGADNNQDGADHGDGAEERSPQGQFVVIKPAGRDPGGSLGLGWSTFKFQKFLDIGPCS